MYEHTLYANRTQREWPSNRGRYLSIPVPTPKSVGHLPLLALPYFLLTYLLT